MSLLVVGSIALDSVKTPFGKAEDALGGSAVYFSCAATFFNKARLVGVVGADFPAKYIKLLGKRGVDTQGLKIDGGKTFRWKGEYDYDLNTAHTIYTHLNVFADFKPEIPAAYRDSENVFLANIDPSLQLDVLKQIDSPRLIACDTMNYWIESKPKQLKRLLEHVDIFFCNDREAREFSGEHNLLKAARYIFSCGPKIAIIKKGEHGVLCVSKKFVFSYPAYILEDPFDPTGAGDTFAGGFMGYVSRAKRVNEAELRKACAFGTILASYTVEDFSVNRLLRLGKKDISGRYAKFRRLMHISG
ncbi:MAG TPA: PfkB family carbohydrate kinase [Candidatus Omnitrophota bacterium]|nr:sugar kinase [Candidatus Omnitrophota bacterium]HOX09340.1 PfkB family carbohydrate kinase [Candidatus Omnitrophota bacterium]HPN65944.1 PfkB family carbohydrate kinase [Candidatus Omnitrophota bacterium]